MIRTVSDLVERKFNEDRVVHAAIHSNAPLSPCCSQPVQGSAIRWCGQCGHTIPAADIDHEYKPPTEVTR